MKIARTRRLLSISYADAGSEISDRNVNRIWMRPAIAALLFACLLAPSLIMAQSASLQPNSKHDPNVREALTIVLRPEGFNITSIKLPHGKYALGVFNRSGRQDISFELDKMPGNSVKGAPEAQLGNKQLHKAKQKWLDGFTLEPGTYRLRVANYPDVVCKIVVEQSKQSEDSGI